MLLHSSCFTLQCSEGLGTKPDGRKVLDYADKAIAAATSRDQQIIKQAYNRTFIAP